MVIILQLALASPLGDGTGVRKIAISLMAKAKGHFSYPRLESRGKMLPRSSERGI